MYVTPQSFSRTVDGFRLLLSNTTGILPQDATHASEEHVFCQFVHGLAGNAHEGHASVPLHPRQSDIRFDLLLVEEILRRRVVGNSKISHVNSNETVSP